MHGRVFYPYFSIRHCKSLYVPPIGGLRLALVLFLLVLIVILSVLIVLIVLLVLIVVLLVLVLVLIVVLVLHNEHSFFVIWELHTHYALFYSDLCGFLPFDCHSK